ncbi:hypothetical protein BH10ACT7_BH10ACT7_19950 [soil metagenome]
MTEQIDELFAEPGPAPGTLSIPELRVLLQRQTNLIVETGTGGRSFKDVDSEYKRGDALLTHNFARLGLEPPVPWRSLWEWYGFYSQNLGSYQERREYVAGLVRDALDALRGVEAGTTVVDASPVEHDPTWEELNARVAGLLDEVNTARDRDAWQDVGRRSREILIDVGKLIADAVPLPEGQEPPKGGDARAWFDVLLGARASGSDKKELRQTMRASWDLAQKVTHGDIDAVDAYSSAQATVLLVRAVQMLLSDGLGD